LENHHSGDTLKVLIAYGTRYGATTGTSEEIPKISREEGFDTKIVNLKEEKIKDISEYDLIIVGIGMGEEFEYVCQKEGMMYFRKRK
jgi:menaquinone-dependent protoporphyrinogen IX oxidase